MISRNLPFGARSSSARTAVVTSRSLSMVMLIRFAAEKTGDLPAVRFLHVAKLLARHGQHRIRRCEAYVAQWRQHFHENLILRGRALGKNAYEMRSESVDHGSIRFRIRADFYSFAKRKAPVAGLGMRFIEKAIRCILIKDGVGRCAKNAAPLRIGRSRAFLCIRGERLPANRIV